MLIWSKRLVQRGVARAELPIRLRGESRTTDLLTRTTWHHSSAMRRRQPLDLRYRDSHVPARDLFRSRTTSASRRYPSTKQDLNDNIKFQVLRNLARIPYVHHWSDPEVNLLMPSITFCEFPTCRRRCSARSHVCGRHSNTRKVERENFRTKSHLLS